MSDIKPPTVKTKITRENRAKEVLRVKLKGEKIVAFGNDLKRIYRVRN